MKNVTILQKILTGTSLAAVVLLSSVPVMAMEEAELSNAAAPTLSDDEAFSDDEALDQEIRATLEALPDSPYKTRMLDELSKVDSSLIRKKVEDYNQKFHDNVKREFEARQEYLRMKSQLIDSKTPAE